MKIHKTTQFLPSGDFNQYYSLLTPAFTTSGPALIVAVQSMILKGNGVGEVFGINEDRILLMGNMQTVNTGPCDIEEFLNQFPYMNLDDKELVTNILTEQLKQLEESLNKPQ
jgi:hypothetical protein